MLGSNAFAHSTVHRLTRSTSTAVHRGELVMPRRLRVLPSTRQMERAWVLFVCRAWTFCTEDVCGGLGGKMYFKESCNIERHQSALGTAMKAFVHWHFAFV